MAAFVLPDMRLTLLCKPLQATIRIGVAYPFIITFSDRFKCYALISVCTKQPSHLLVRYPIHKIGERDLSQENDRKYYNENGIPYKQEYKKFRHAEHVLDYLGFSDEFIKTYYPDYVTNIVDFYHREPINEIVPEPIPVLDDDDEVPF